MCVCVFSSWWKPFRAKWNGLQIPYLHWNGVCVNIDPWVLTSHVSYIIFPSEIRSSLLFGNQDTAPWCNWRGYTLCWPRHENIPEPDENDEMPGDVRKGSECLNNVSGVPCPPGPSHFPVTGDWNADCCATGRITDMTVTIIPTLPSWRTMTWWSKDIGDIRHPDIRTGVSQPREEQTVTFL